MMHGGSVPCGGRGVYPVITPPPSISSSLCYCRWQSGSGQCGNKARPCLRTRNGPCSRRHCRLVTVWRCAFVCMCTWQTSWQTFIHKSKLKWILNVDVCELTIYVTHFLCVWGCVGYIQVCLFILSINVLFREKYSCVWENLLQLAAVI